MSEFTALSTPWESRAGSGPLLRGRRFAGRQPLIHFLHGNGFCGGVYWPLLRGLVEDGHALFCHDLEGHGASAAPERYSGTPAILRRVPQVIAEQCGTQPLIGLGHSFGAAVTMAVAAHQPARFRALVLLDPIFLPPRLWWLGRIGALLGRNPIAEAARRRRAQWPSREALLERLRGRGIYRGWDEAALQAFADHASRDAADGSRVLCCPPRIEAAIFEQPVWPWRLLRQLQMPVLLLHGRDSYPFMAPAAARAAALNPRIEVHALPGGHCFMLEDPAPTLAMIRAFLQRHA